MSRRKTAGQKKVQDVAMPYRVKPRIQRPLSLKVEDTTSGRLIKQRRKRATEAATDIVIALYAPALRELEKH